MSFGNKQEKPCRNFPRIFFQIEIDLSGKILEKLILTSVG